MAIDKQRRESIIEAMRETSLQLLACFSPPEVLLLTGYWPVMGASLAVFTRSGQAFCIIPEDELELAKATSNANFLAYQPHSLDKVSGPAESLAAALKTLSNQLRESEGADRREIGTTLHDVQHAAPYQSTNHFRASVIPLLSQAYPDASVASADAMLDRLKSRKTPVELDQLRRASKLAAAGFDEAEHAIVAGRREDEVAADIESAFARVANDGFERGRGYFFCMSGPNSAKAASAYARTRRRIIEDGDMVMVHANTVGDGIWTDITRTYIAGQPSDLQRRIRQAVAEAREAALSAIAPGVRAKEVDAAARNVIAKHGFAGGLKHSTGHGVGFAAADPDALPRIHPRSPDLLEVGMTFNIEPAIYIEGTGGMRHCDVVACTSSGVEVLTDFSQSVGLSLKPSQSAAT